MKKIFKRTGVITASALVIIQFIRPDQTNPDSDPAKSIVAVQGVPAEISGIMDRACRDCHSNHTVWPWYAGIAPVSWVVADDVKEARKHLNFSEWGTYKKARKVKKLSQMGEEVAGHSMPLPKYILLHPEADLTAGERKLFSAWAETEADNMGGETADSTE